MSGPSQNLGVEIAQIFLERAEFSHRSDWLAFPHNTPAAVGPVNVNLEVATNAKGDQGMARIEVSTRGDQNLMYSFRVAYVALVTKSDLNSGLELAKYLQHSGPLLLYPFLRQTVADLTLKGRFGAVWLSPFSPTAFVTAPPRVAVASAQPTKAKRKLAAKKARR